MGPSGPVFCGSCRGAGWVAAAYICTPYVVSESLSFRAARKSGFQKCAISHLRCCCWGKYVLSCDRILASPVLGGGGGGEGRGKISKCLADHCASPEKGAQRGRGGGGGRTRHIVFSDRFFVWQTYLMGQGYYHHLTSKKKKKKKTHGGGVHASLP